MSQTVCRKCGILLMTSATIAMGICGSCLVYWDSRSPILPRPTYGQPLVTEPPQVPEIV